MSGPMQLPEASLRRTCLDSRSSTWWRCSESRFGPTWLFRVRVCLWYRAGIVEFVVDDRGAGNAGEGCEVGRVGYCVGLAVTLRHKVFFRINRRLKFWAFVSLSFCSVKTKEMLLDFDMDCVFTLILDLWFWTEAQRLRWLMGNGKIIKGKSYFGGY